MGYYTYFRPEIITAKTVEEEETITAEMERIFNFTFEEPQKWYTYKEDMDAFSAGYPDHIFQITGEGEERDDNWQCRFKNGASECIEPEVIWPMYEQINYTYEQIQKQEEGSVQIESGNVSSTVVDRA